MIDLPSLYPHQEDLRDRTRAALRKHRRVILTAPPGCGKTRMAKWILGASANREPGADQSGHSLFAVQRRGLVDNASSSLSEEPKLRHGVIMSGVKAAYGANVQVASIDTLLSWFVDGGQYDTSITFDLIVYDETHAHLSKLARFLQHHDAYRKEIGKHPAYVIGLSATPEAKGLADVYREIVLGPPTQWLIDNGFLAPFRYFRATQGRLGLLVKQGDRFTEESEAKAMAGLSGAMVRDWERFAKGRPTVGFFPRRQHAQEAREAFEEAGLRTAYVDGDTDDDTRKRYFWELNTGRLDYLCNVQVLERGTDIPLIQCVQLCVAIGSLPKFRQVIGRGSRVHPEKTDCCVARDTLILTDRGQVPIQDVRLTDRVWDGVEFCCHDGPCYNGTREVIEWEGLTLTPDHKVLTNDGWKEAAAAKAGQWRPVIAGYGGQSIRTTDDSNPHYPWKRPHIRGRSRLLAVWEAMLALLPQNIAAEATGVPELHANVRDALPGVGVETSAASAAAVPVPSERGVPSIRWAWDRIQVLFHLRRGVLGRGESGAATEQVVDHRQDRQQRSLRAGQPAMGHMAHANAKPERCLEGEAEEDLPICDLLRRTTPQSEEAGIESEADCRPLVVEVWDILNAGPRNRYCANGLIVANCILDHGGNVLRHGFFEDDPLWSLDRSEKAVGDSKARTAIECPKCQSIYRGGKCRNCGYEPTKAERRVQGLEWDGAQLVEVKKGERVQKVTKTAEDLMLKALYSAGRSGRTWKQAVGMFLGMSKAQGTKYRVPKRVSVGLHYYKMLPYGHLQSGRKVCDLFPWTAERGKHGGDFME